MQRFRDKRKVVSLTLVGLAYLLIVIPLIVSNVQKNQTLHQYAATAQPTPTPAVCGQAASNTQLIIDHSGSMGEQDGSSGTKMSNAITAANNFVSLASQNPQNEVGLTSFSTTATNNSPLTSDFTSVKTQINTLKASGDTCIQCAIDQASQAVTAGKRSNIKNVIVLLTDGIANYVEGTNKQVSESTAEQAALTAATNAHNANDTIIFVIGLGSDVNTAFLQQLATSTGGQYYFPPTTDNLNDIYSQISQIIAQGSVSGFVYNDANGNGKFDTGEQKLTGWTVQLTEQGSTTPTTITTDSTGAFMIPHLCNGTYTLTEVTQSGWKETAPTNPNSYTINITTGNALTDEDFGNIVAPPTPTPTPKPTATPTPKPTSTPTPTLTPTPTPKPTAVPTQTTVPNAAINMTVYLDGIGSRGDNTNPTASSLSNKNPQHQTIGAQTQIYTLNNNLIASGTGTLIYNATLGAFTGDVPISAGFPSGQYLVKVKTDYHLRKQVDGIQTITASNDNTITPVSLVAGDIDNNNVINILDYNILIGCYSDLTAAVSCTPAQQVASDLNDDGAVNQDDYNLFLRELSTQPGQ
jgi:Mg-chelatase subunit ChlD